MGYKFRKEYQNNVAKDGENFNTDVVTVTANSISDVVGFSSSKGDGIWLESVVLQSIVDDLNEISCLRSRESVADELVEATKELVEWCEVAHRMATLTEVLSRVRAALQRVEKRNV